MSKRKAIRKLPSVEYLRECFTYNRRTGELRWKRRPREHFPTIRGWKIFNSSYAGTSADDTFDAHGYRQTYILSDVFKSHRIVWKIATGEEPPIELDHKDGNRSNNRVGNLRSATSTEQKCNSVIRSDNSSGRRGVSLNHQNWMAYVNFRGVRHYLGTFKTVEEAHAVRDAAARKLHGEFFRES